MNRETELHFAQLPKIDIPRSKFKVPHNHKSTASAGDLVPIYLTEVLPGDTVSMEMASVIRMITPLYPTMDNASVDICFFYVPTRLVWDHWKEFWGENTNAWYQPVEYEVPQLTTGSGATFAAKSVADYFGLPTGVANLSVSALPFRCYAKLWSDWWRDENLQSEALNYTGDNNLQVTNVAYRGGALLKANKYHDYFSSCLPAPLKSGASVTLPLGTVAPVRTLTTDITIPTGEIGGSLRWKPTATSDTFDAGYHYTPTGIAATGGSVLSSTEGIKGSTHSVSDGVTMYPSNLWADLSSATAATITELRQAFAIQRFFEAQARGGWAIA